MYVDVDEKVYHGLYTLMNKFGEVTGWWFIRTGKTIELEQCIMKIKKRYEMHNFDRPLIVYSDRPEMDRSVWERIWPSIEPDQEETAKVNNHSADTILKLPEKELPTVVYQVDECSAVVTRIRECIHTKENETVLGFDIEWNRGCYPVATIQLSLKCEKSFIFCIKSLIGKR